MQQLMAAVIMCLIFMAGCAEKQTAQPVSIVGIWTTTFKTWQNQADKTPMSMELRSDGRVILLTDQEEEVGFASYQYDTTTSPHVLTITFDHDTHEYMIAKVEHLDEQTMQLQMDYYRSADKQKPMSLYTDVFRRSSEHVLPRGADASQRDEMLRKALESDIWFHGEKGPQMVDICEALFRYQFTNNASARQDKAKAYFLSIGRRSGRDPEPPLMARFADDPKPVLPGSQFTVGNGVKFHITSIVWLDEQTVEAKGGYYEGPLSSARRNTYRLALKDNRWEVVSFKQGSIS